MAQAAKDHGISEGLWLDGKRSNRCPVPEFSRLQKQNRELLELVGEITLKLSMTQKNNERRKKQISACRPLSRASLYYVPRMKEKVAPQGPPGRRAADPSLLRLPVLRHWDLPPAGAEGHASVWHQALPQERQKMEKIGFGPIPTSCSRLPAFANHIWADFTEFCSTERRSMWRP